LAEAVRETDPELSAQVKSAVQSALLSPVPPIPPSTSPPATPLVKLQ